MKNPNYVLFYVKNPAISCNFYAKLLKLQPIENSPSYVMFNLESGIKLGLWIKDQVEPAATLTGGGSELCFPVDDNDSVDTLYANWQKQGLAFAQTPTEMDFGYTFVALDPDGHRLRVFAIN